VPITEADYPKLTELLTLTHTVTLDCERGPYTEDELDDDEGDAYIYLSFGGNEDFYGNVESYYLRKLGEKALAKRFRTFVQPDGEIGLEISFLPGEPFGGSGFDEHAKALWDATRISELMGYDEYIRDLKEGADWVNELLGEGGEMYALLIEVTKPGREPSIEDYDEFFSKPLWIQRKGQKYNVHIRYWQD
jgi:hypothetical protein